MFIRITRGCMVMLVDRVYKISAFGDFTCITATPDNMQYFFETFKSDNLLPSVFQEVKINVSPVPALVPETPIANQRIMLISSDNLTNISIGTNRIDYEVTANNDIRISTEKRTSINQNAVRAYTKIFSKFRKTANRLALNTESLIINLNSEQIMSFMKQYSNPISLYHDVLMDEWSTRLMVRKSINIGETNETLNLITIIQKQIMQKLVDGKSVHHDGFALNTDINTIAENTLSRFSAPNIAEFINAAVDWWDKIIEEVDGKNEENSD